MGYRVPRLGTGRGPTPSPTPSERSWLRATMPGVIFASAGHEQGPALHPHIIDEDHADLDIVSAISRISSTSLASRMGSQCFEQLRLLVRGPPHR